MKQYKVIKIYYDFKLSSIEKVMNDMAKEGWEVVCMTHEPSNTSKYIITFSREENKAE